MHNVWRYILLFAVTLLLQLFFFDRLTAGVWFAPVIYTAAVLLLPVNTPPIVVLLAGLASGLAADAATGMEGLNVIATLAVAYVRRPLLLAFGGHDIMREAAAPSAETLGRAGFCSYALAAVALHALIFHLLEALSLAHLLRTLGVWAACTAESFLCLLIASRLFTVSTRVRP